MIWNILFYTTVYYKLNVKLSFEPVRPLPGKLNSFSEYKIFGIVEILYAPKITISFDQLVIKGFLMC